MLAPLPSPTWKKNEAAAVREVQTNKRLPEGRNDPETTKHIHLPITDANLEEKMLNPLNNGLKDELHRKNENKLAKEVRQVYCQLSQMKKNQAIILAQTSGLLAAEALGLKCSRIEGRSME